MKRFLSLLLLLSFTAARADEPREVTVFAAASLREVFEDLGKQLEAKAPGTKVSFSFAGSQELRAQIEQGARADVFASADLEHMAALEKAGTVASSRVFARNELVVVVPHGAAGVKTFADLPSARRLVIGAAEVPAGNYTRRMLDKASAGSLGKDFKDRVMAKVVSNELNVRQVLAKVTLGEADAGVVYRTDAQAAKDKVDVIAIPAGVNVIAEYPIAVLKSAPHARVAQAFVDLVLSADGQQRLAAAGFSASSAK